MTGEQQRSEAGRRADEYVRTGQWPPPSARPCHDCGHVWFRGERRHEYDVDRLNDLGERHEDVHVVCVLCLGQRQLAREEDGAGEQYRTHW